ncbi:YARHG domain-containing protein [Pseudobutyrivibrio sp. 49]|uniref:YARHG domain-containing protein n=1 Tax=Pseudobutyrivibrio sp. 49 TaxID=1855344 RepID=UPI00088D1EAD|nr:YARHG domain-containing protein [Pseudobutyrivibrio sp. 49]SDH89218.1 YARHG domain-containing protein [Pseudobutyrivibrio sp. 49]
MKLKTRYVKQIMMVLSLTSIIGLVGCAKNDEPTIQNSEEQITQSTDNIDVESNEDETDYTISKEDYSSYEGTWTLDGKPLNGNGAELTIQINNGNQLTGSMCKEEDICDRFAEIENISATITNGECYYSFSDDGWGDTGTLYIVLSDNRVKVEVQDFVMSDENLIGYGINGTYDLIKVDETNDIAIEFEKYNEDWDDDKISDENKKRRNYRDNCSFYSEFVAYMEEVRGVTDISYNCYPLYDTDSKYYEASDFINDPSRIIYLAKNEIYARHGYIFTDPDLYDFFMGQLWYVPTVEAEDFDDSVFNEYEKANLQLLSQLDKH